MSLSQPSSDILIRETVDVSQELGIEASSNKAA